MAVFKRDAVYTIEEASDTLRVHPNTLYRLCRSGELAAYRAGIGKKAGWRIPGSELEKLKFSPVRPGPKPKRKEAAE